jgi:hypothetical protein
VNFWGNRHRVSRCCPASLRLPLIAELP